MADYSSYSEESDFDDYLYDRDNEPQGMQMVKCISCNVVTKVYCVVCKCDTDTAL